VTLTTQPLLVQRS